MTPRPSRKPSAQMEEARAEIDRQVTAAIDALLRREWRAAGAAEKTGEYAQILVDVVSISVLNKRELIAEYLEVIAEETLKTPADKEENFAIADKANDIRREAEMDGIVLVARAAGQSAAPRAAPAPPAGFVSTTWKIVSRVVAAIGALLLLAFAVALAFSGSTGELLGTRIAAVIFLLGGAAMLVVQFFFPGALSRFTSRISQRSIEQHVERTLRKDLEKRYRK